MRCELDEACVRVCLGVMGGLVMRLGGVRSRSACMRASAR